MWTKSQKISAAVLGLAVVAFGVDRWVLSAPEGAADANSAAAAEEFVVARPAAATVASAPATNTTATVTSPAATMTLASRLNALGTARRFDFEPVGDAFRAAEDWFPPEEKPADAPAPAAAEVSAAATPAKPVRPKIDHAAVFTNRHTLTAVMSNKDGGQVILNGRIYVPGQQVDGFKLVTVGDGYATFTGRGTKVTLKVNRAPTASPVADAR
jgi:hypothetical protein